MTDDGGNVFLWLDASPFFALDDKKCTHEKAHDACLRRLNIRSLIHYYDRCVDVLEKLDGLEQKEVKKQKNRPFYLRTGADGRTALKQLKFRTPKFDFLLSYQILWLTCLYLLLKLERQEHHTEMKRSIRQTTQQCQFLVGLRKQKFPDAISGDDLFLEQRVQYILEKHPNLMEQQPAKTAVNVDKNKNNLLAGLTADDLEQEAQELQQMAKLPVPHSNKRLKTEDSDAEAKRQKTEGADASVTQYERMLQLWSPEELKAVAERTAAGS